MRYMTRHGGRTAERRANRARITRVYCSRSPGSRLRDQTWRAARDLKPSTSSTTPTATPTSPISYRAFSAARPSNSPPAPVGTPSYMSPKQGKANSRTGAAYLYALAGSLREADGSAVRRRHALQHAVKHVTEPQPRPPINPLLPILGRAACCQGARKAVRAALRQRPRAGSTRCARRWKTPAPDAAPPSHRCPKPCEYLTPARAVAPRAGQPSGAESVCARLPAQRSIADRFRWPRARPQAALAGLGTMTWATLLLLLVGGIVAGR